MAEKLGEGVSRWLSFHATMLSTTTVYLASGHFTCVKYVYLQFTARIYFKVLCSQTPSSSRSGCYGSRQFPKEFMSWSLCVQRVDPLGRDPVFASTSPPRSLYVHTLSAIQYKLRHTSTISVRAIFFFVHVSYSISVYSASSTCLLRTPRSDIPAAAVFLWCDGLRCLFQPLL